MRADATGPIIPLPRTQPQSSQNDKTILIGPEITIPGLNDMVKAAPTPAVVDKTLAAGPMPASPSDFTTMEIERPQHGGVGPALKTPVAAPDENGAMRIERTQSPDATIRIKPHPQEPA